MNKTFKIVKIINEYEIVINAGKDHGIYKDQSLEIFVPGEEVIDPETNESLGTLDFIKAYLNVKNVFPKMAICENSETKSKNFLTAFNNLTIEENQRLNVDSQEISGGLSGSRKIRIGDMVRESR